MKYDSTEPLAARMRPRTIDEVVGQRHILGPGKLLRRVIEADRLTNIILYGPPGCGKTTLAEVIAKATERNFVRCSGVMSNVADIRKVCDRARNELGYNAYRCFGFNLAGILETVDSDRLIGFTFEYEKLADSFTSITDEKYHALMLYEVSFPHTTWH